MPSKNKKHQSLEESMDQVVAEAEAAASEEILEGDKTEATKTLEGDEAEVTEAQETKQPDTIELLPAAPIGATKSTGMSASVAKLKEVLKTHPGGLTVFQIGVLLGRFNRSMDIAKSAADNELYQKVGKDIRSNLRKFVPASMRSEKIGRNTVYKWQE